MTESKMRVITIVAKASLDRVVTGRLHKWEAPECSIVRSQDSMPRIRGISDRV
jgi:hypothetical protein